MKYSKTKEHWVAGDSEKQFPGFKPKYKRDFFTYPTILEQYWWMLSGAEFRVLTFILRHTLGFQKTSDLIALSQFAEGVRGFNKGAGVSISQTRRVLESLEAKGFIVVEKVHGKTSLIRLRLAEDSEPDAEQADAKILKCSEQVLNLIKLFRPVAGHLVDDYLTDKKQVAAIEKLISFYGHERIENLINALPALRHEKYVPRITSPVDLDRKLPDLVAALNRINHNENSDLI